MASFSYVNGQYLPHAHASVHIEDRGYQFADGVYEYIAFYNGILLDEARHWKRFERSLKALGIDDNPRIWPIIARELIERNGRLDGGLYVQVTRGVAKRDHPFPAHVKPALVMTIAAPKTPKPSEIKDGVKVITTKDIRWGRCDIKSVALLANVLAKQEASNAKAREAWLVKKNDEISEGSVSNNYIIKASGTLVTHPADQQILGGIAREVVLELALGAGIKVEERAFTLAEARTASEAFITSTSANVLPVVSLDGAPIGSGKVGPVTKQLMELFYAHVERQSGKSLRP